MSNTLAIHKWAVSLVLKRVLFGMPKIQHWEYRYAKVANIELDANAYVRNKAKKWKQTLDVIMRQTPTSGKIIETGCGTSALSVYLNLKGYENHCIDNNEKILEIAKLLNDKIKTKVKYKYGELKKIPYQNNSFDALFSQGVLEHIEEQEIPHIINEGLRVAKKYIFAIPTICDMSSCLRGDENLFTYWRWRKIISRANCKIITSEGYFPFHPTLQKINSIFKNKLVWIAPTLVFVIKRNKNLIFS